MPQGRAKGVPLRSLRGGALLFCGTALLLSGCPKKAEEGAADADARPAAVPEASPELGLRVPLPKGWTAHTDRGDVLAVGPAGRDVMHIRRSSEKGMPSVEELRSTFTSELAPDVAAEPLAQLKGGDFSLVRLRLHPKDGPSPAWTLALGARRIGNALYFCSTEPGATDAEVLQAAEACAQLGR